MNPGLPGLQRWMLDALLAPRRTEGIDARLTASPMLDARARLAIYQRSYILRLVKCLAEQFPALRHALGAPLFDDFAREYLAACPSDAYTLYELGRRFPGWLEESRPDRELPPDEREDWIDFMVDLARYERELFRLFDAPGHEGGVWPTVDVPDARLVLQPCFALAQYRYPVAWYYHEVRHERSPAFPPAHPSYVAIARRDYLTATFPLNPVHFQFLCALHKLGSVDEALQAVALEVERPLAEVRRSWDDAVRGPWIQAGFFVEREGEI
ncbi:MAG: putative DNA-binding domain-containing protein [Burkholderiales bacterium]|nr:putative DNA-binding domain-containing protein [Burkholderiales bacterium]